MKNSGPKMPLLNCGTDALKTKMREMGFDVEFVGKPVTFEGMTSRPESPIWTVDGLSDESRETLLAYAQNVGADGALVIDVQTTYSDSTIGHIDRGNVTVLPYKLVPSKPVRDETV